MVTVIGKVVPTLRSGTSNKISNVVKAIVSSDAAGMFNRVKGFFGWGARPQSLGDENMVYAMLFVVLFLENGFVDEVQENQVLFIITDGLKKYDNKPGFWAAIETWVMHLAALPKDVIAPAFKATT